MSKQLIQELNKQLANWSVLFTKLHNYHWYVKGDNFFTLHAKFEEFYGEAAVNIDELAERILAIKGQPIATMREYLETATIEEATGNENAKEMVACIAADFETLINEANNVIELAEEASDESTADMFIQSKETLQKHRWMLHAFLG